MKSSRTGSGGWGERAHRERRFRATRNQVLFWVEKNKAEKLRDILVTRFLSHPLLRSAPQAGRGFACRIKFPGMSTAFPIYDT